MTNKRTVLATIVFAFFALCSGAWRVEADTYVQTNLVSDIPGLATITDPSLRNPWGVSHLSMSPFWVSAQGTNVANLYNVTGSTNVSKAGLVVTIPTTGGGGQGPTGQVANTTSSFNVNGAPASFIFANLNGTISAWNGSLGTTASIQATTPGAVYTGLAISGTGAQSQLYAANNSQGRIDVFSGSFSPVNLGAGAFATPTAFSQAGLVPFNVQTIGGLVYVTYAPTGAALRSATAGMGAIAIFSTSGSLQQTQIGGQFASPWGMTMTPSSFGQFANDLLVGNFSFASSWINVLDPVTLAFLGKIMIDVGNGNTPGGLWFLGFGQAGNNGSPDTLYFTDGINGEADGLFGAIQPTPLPGALPLFATGLGALGLLGWRRKRKNAATPAA